MRRVRVVRIPSNVRVLNRWVVYATVAASLSACTSTNPPDRGSRTAAPSRHMEKTVAGVVLVTPGPAMEAYCQEAADLLDRDVPCLTLLPSDLGSSTLRDELCNGELITRRCFPQEMFALDIDFRGPPTYRGVRDADGEMTPYGHLLFWSYPAREREDEVRCLGYRRRIGPASIRGERATWYRCPEIDGRTVERFPIDSGHVFIEWRKGDAVIGVSLHGHTAANRRLAVALAESLTYSSVTVK